MPTTRREKLSTRKPSESTVCPQCGVSINKMGLGRHKGSESCRRAAAERDGKQEQPAPVDAAYSELLNSYIDASMSTHLFSVCNCHIKINILDTFTNPIPQPVPRKAHINTRRHKSKITRPQLLIVLNRIQQNCVHFGI